MNNTMLLTKEQKEQSGLYTLTTETIANKQVESASLNDYEHLRITDLTKIPMSTPVLKICGEVVAMCDEFSIISGAPKSGKSALVGMCIASAISANGNINDNIEGLEIMTNIGRKAVIHIDTEQAPHKQQYNIKTMVKRAGYDNCPDHFLSFNIRKEDISNYESITSGICKAAYLQFGEIHSIWIDGGADYIVDVNDTQPSNSAIKFFGDLAEKYHTAVIVIIHTNPNSDKLRGNFGSQGQRKTGGSILIKKGTDEVSTVIIHDLRYGGGAVSKLAFKYDKEKGYHVGCRATMDATEETKAKNKIKSTWTLCQQIYSSNRSYLYNSAIKEIMKVKACGERTAKNDFKQMNIQEMILQGEKDQWQINLQYTNVL